MKLTQSTNYTKNPQINVIDSIMGSGKSSWAIHYMNEAPPRQKFIYITPFKDEIERVIGAVTNRKFVQPSDDKSTKLVDIKRLFAEGENIASTHSLFSRMDSEMMELLEIEDYTLILDEVMDVIKPLDYPVNDLNLLYKREAIRVDNNGFVEWLDNDYIGDEGYFTKLRNLANAGNLMMYEDETGNPVVVYWTFPVDSFKCFNETYLLTYLFDGQVQRTYFDLFNVQYKYFSVDCFNGRYQLIDYVPYDKENRQHLKDNITIYYPAPSDKKDMNRVGNKRTDFSVGNLKNRSKQSVVKKVIRDSAYNFYRNKSKASPEDVMFTTFKAVQDKITPHGLKDSFVSVNCRATNEYKDKSTCIYLANIFMNPVTINFFEKHGVSINEDKFALSELLQWLFRSQIRENKPIDLYIPSKRMRTLLEKYLDNKI